MTPFLTWLLLVISHIPAECSLYGQCKQGTLSGVERSKDTPAIMQAIVDAGLSGRDAIEAAVYAAYESANKLDASGDGGKSHGAWQINVDGLDAKGQLLHWLTIRKNSIERCAGNRPDERLAALASGSCTRGKAKVRARSRVVDRLWTEYP